MARKFLTNIDMSNLRIINLANPQADQDAATKAYVDSLVEGLAWKDNVRVATTGNINLSAPGSTIDGVTLSIGDRVLVKNQTSPAQNGIYIYNNDDSGTASKFNLGSGLPRPTAGGNQAWDLRLLSDDEGNVYWAVTALATGATASGVLNTDLPARNTLLTFLAYISVGGTSSVIGVGLSMLEAIQVV